MKLSVIIPCYNEKATLHDTVDAVLSLASATLEVELIVVDDCSTDGSRDLANSLAQKHSQIKLLCHEVNRGKGAALRTGFMAATGDYVCVQDADNEYNPAEYLKLLRTASEQDAAIVFGSRYLSRSERRVLRFWHSTMNRLLTLLSNCFSDLDLTDMETCYKLFRHDVIAELAPKLREERFGFEPEVTARIAKAMKTHDWQIAECAIGYRPRTFAQGKKIGCKDGVRAIWCIIKYNIFTQANT